MTVAERILTPDGTRFTAPDGSFLNSLAAINLLSDEARDQIYRTLLVDEMLDRYAIDRETLRNLRGEAVVTFDASPNVGLVELRLWRQLADRDPLLYMQLADTTNNQIIILLFITSDPDSPRFSVDRDWGGEPTKFGTLSRNIEAEVAAMEAGLSPGQVRQGLRLARKMLPSFEQFIARLGHEIFLLEPLAYHSAILFESFGCAYSQGRRRMERIHQGFQPGGEYFLRLDGSTPFRRPGVEKTVRGRSWAIHDGILGEPYTDYHMYKNVGKHAGVSTFPNYVW
jgi:hypothetical protein